MSEEKEVFIERAAQGSFGFSILGGAGMKYPACVCELDSGGPAELSEMVRGRQIVWWGGEFYYLWLEPIVVSYVHIYVGYF